MVYFVSEVKVILCARKAKDIDSTALKERNFIGMRKFPRQDRLFSDLNVYFVERWPYSSDQEIGQLYIL